ncbi:MAG: dTDP-4-dehydrorhamnose 3,5-epimerase family protein [Halothiobacillus sp.]|nr:dTDP-4-dehydrorhamnose 3,5-epimerase family protein [Halothiobacillus sp.]
MTDSAQKPIYLTDFYAPDCEDSIRWNDATLAIDWPVMAEPRVSVKDGEAPAYLVARTFE